MPQYEIKNTESPETVVRVRARSAVEAVINQFELDESTTTIEIEGGVHFEALEGWQDANVDGETIARIRVFQRMKFRRA